ncbi:T9SS type A sorting domain-containing protein [Flavobacterium dankookense]|uniref:Putative secreted protein (Por secretion system target) n=1 Tax=Flavobacterium dankookense TaxID=706186 RepID=A0A4R6QFK1_9FLAO|nr:T9SS type A sorting domain-containing protein [Flavobacterium dankookense]TDP60723.1 putative secreted protein (Por secretion system target) [Flavobacterium dankookense]
MKKKLLFYLIFIMGIQSSMGQFTAIPDVNFEQALIDLTLDDVIDQQVLTASIDNITSLSVSFRNISDLSGIQDFIGLQVLDCSNNTISVLNLSGMSSLQTLYSDGNQINQINLSGLSSLENLRVSNNQLTTINLTNLLSLKRLECENNFITSLDASSLSNLEYLVCVNNNLTSLNISGLSNLTVLSCAINQLTTLDVSSLSSIQLLICSINQLSALDLSGLSTLNQLQCGDNAFSVLDVRGLSNLSVLLTTNSPLLTCILVDDITLATSNSNWYKDATASYTIDCSCPTIITPTFAEIAPICTSGSLSPLPTTSLNGIIGTWSPAFNNTQTTTYTFTPNTGQCASTITKEIIINLITNQINISTGIDTDNYFFPQFNVDINWLLVNDPVGFGGYALGIETLLAPSEATPVVATNARWINNSGALQGGAPPGLCVYEKTITVVSGFDNLNINFSIAHDNNLVSLEIIRPDLSIININPPLTPYYLSQPINNDFTNPMVGDWKIRVVTKIAFTPVYTETGAFLLSGFATLSSAFLVTPTFTDIGSICSSDVLPPLPSTSINGITGTWSPALDNTQTTTYTFTPNAGQCATEYAMTIVVNTATTWYADTDNDTFGDINNSVLSCDQPFGYVSNNTDCDDNNILAYQLFPFYVDADADGFGGAILEMKCSEDSAIPPPGYATDFNDCDDNNPAINEQFTFYPDNDGDGFGDLVSVRVCSVDEFTAPTGFSINNDDCDDSNAAINTRYLFYPDNDGDGYGNFFQVMVCAVNATTPPTGYVTNGIDCDDNDPTITPLPLFNQVAPICAGATLAPLPTTALNGIIGFWSPALDNTQTTTYTFFPNSFLCATTATMTIVVTPCGPTTPINPALCGTTLTNIGSIINAVGVGSGANYLFEVTDVGSSPVAPIVQTYVTGGSPNFSLTSLPSFHYATTYSVRVKIFIGGAWSNAFSAPCLISTPNVVLPTGQAQVNPSQCGATLTSLSTLIATTSLPRVQCYRFKVTDLTTGQVQTITRSLHWFSLTMLTNFNYGTTYSVEVAVSTDCVNFSPFGNSCNVTTPAVPRLTTYCGIVVPTKTTAIATLSLPQVNMYHFEVTRLDSSGNPLGTPKDIFKNAPQNYFALNDLQALPYNIYAPNTNYSVRIRVMSAGTWSPFGLLPCVITSPNIARMMEEEKATELFEVMAYPNPFNNHFEISLQSTDRNNVSIKVYDMVGRLIEDKNVNANEVSTIEFGTNYPTGVYNVIVSQSNNQRSFRIIKR